MTAVIYARYSSDNQREESIEGQIRECTAYAEKNGITVVRHYIDRAISAKTDNRPQFQQMIKDSERKLFDIVLVWKLDRFARNRYDSARYKTQLKKNGVKLMSATEIISDGPEGIILESVLEGYAGYYSADLSEKVVRGMTENALKGKYNGGAVPIGYVIDAEQRFQPDSLTATFVAEAFKRYNEGATMTEIRDWMNEHRVKNPRGGPMTYNTVQHMLNNRRYIGELKYRDILIADAIPPLVSAELFQEVQEKMAKNKKAPARRKAEDDYLLTTKLFCGHCGALMFGESGTSRTGDVHRYYKCAAAKKRKSCNKKTVRKQWLEDLVINETIKLIQDDAVIDSLVAAVMELQNRESTSLPLYEKQLRETEAGIQNMLNAIQAGILTSSTKERLEALEAQKKDLEAKIAEEKLAKPVMKEEFVRFWLLHFRKLDLSKKEQRQALIDTFINAIYLYDDKVLITFNYKEGTETISFGEATEAAAKEKSSDMDCLGAPRRLQQWLPFFVLHQKLIQKGAPFAGRALLYVTVCQKPFQRGPPTQNRATVPGPLWAPMTGPMSPCWMSVTPRARSLSTTYWQSSAQSPWLMNTVPPLGSRAVAWKCLTKASRLARRPRTFSMATRWPSSSTWSTGLMPSNVPATAAAPDSRPPRLRNIRSSTVNQAQTVGASSCA